MNAETDRATYWQAMARYTGRSVRYLKVRALVRAAVAIVPISAAYAYALTFIK